MKNNIIKIFLLLFVLAIKATFAQEFAGGTGTEDDPFLISTPEHLQNIANYYQMDDTSKCFHLINDIDLGVPPWNQGTGWKPISTCMGKVYGNGYKIKNMYINLPDSEHVGLFAFLVHPYIDGVGVENCNVTGKRFVGGLVSRVISLDHDVGKRNKISNCYVTGKIQGEQDVGGFIGARDYDSRFGCLVYRCWTNVEVNGVFSGTSMFIGWGGLVTYESFVSGSAQGESSSVSGLTGGLFRCYATGTVEGKTNRIWGGASGLNGGINESFSAVDVTGELDVGGLGEAPLTIKNSYSVGDVSGTVNVGGLAASTRESIINSYSFGTVWGDSAVGGIVGTTNRSHWDWDESLNADSLYKIEKVAAINSEVWGRKNVHRIIGNKRDTFNLIDNYALDSMLVNGSPVVSYDASNLDGKNISDEVLKTQAFYEDVLGWDFDSVWQICENCKYPIFQWQSCEDCPFPTDIIEIKDLDVKVTPNPVVSDMIVSFYLETPSFINIDVYDLEGKELSNLHRGWFSGGNFTESLSAGNLATGSYTLRINIGNKTKIVRFVKM